MEDIRQYEVTRKFLNENRWFVVFRMPFNGKKRMPLSNYVWLVENPQFGDLPPGYCIHHLDHDKMNNDISNLALMKKSHHMAYHTKQNNDKEQERVKLRPPIGIGSELTVPTITQTVVGKSPIWTFRWQETDIGGKRVSRAITRIKDKLLRTEEEAERARNLFMKIHPSFKSEEDMPKIYNLLQQISQEIEADETEDAYSLIKNIFPQI